MKLQKLIGITGQTIETVPDNSTIYDAAELIFTDGATSVLILNKAKQSIGLITEQEVVLAIKTYKQKILEMKVTDIMNIDLLACGPDEEVEEAVRVMGQYKIRNLPIITESGNLTGFIDINAVARAQLSSIIQKWG